MLGASFLSTIRQVLVTLHVTIETGAKTTCRFRTGRGFLKATDLSGYKMFVFHLIYDAIEWDTGDWEIFVAKNFLLITFNSEN